MGRLKKASPRQNGGTGEFAEPRGRARAEIEVKKSRFIAEIFPVSTPGEARQLIKQQKERMTGASHVAHAFVLGSRGETRGMSDAGEPHGTAGRPILDALGGQNCTNILLTVTRYFGGTLLGTGGLARAYGAAARAALGECELSSVHPD
jgi:uncharacterized YigZ family protein